MSEVELLQQKANKRQYQFIKDLHAINKRDSMSIMASQLFGAT